MNSIVNQFITEENEIRANLKKAGYSDDDIDARFALLKNQDPDAKIRRNSAIREIAVVMKKYPVALKSFKVHDLIAKVTGLSPNYINQICTQVDPTKLLKNPARY